MPRQAGAGGQKSALTARLTIGSTEKTLTSAEIEEVANSVLKKLSKRFGAGSTPAEPALFSGTGAFSLFTETGRRRILRSI